MNDFSLFLAVLSVQCPWLVIGRLCGAAKRIVMEAAISYPEAPYPKIELIIIGFSVGAACADMYSLRLGKLCQWLLLWYSSLFACKDTSAGIKISATSVRQLAHIHSASDSGRKASIGWTATQPVLNKRNNKQVNLLRS